MVQQASAVMKSATGGNACNMDILAWWVGGWEGGVVTVVLVLHMHSYTQRCQLPDASVLMFLHCVNGTPGAAARTSTIRF
jgi:hypothetical protein